MKLFFSLRKFIPSGQSSSLKFSYLSLIENFVCLIMINSKNIASIELQRAECCKTRIGEVAEFRLKKVDAGKSLLKTLENKVV